MNLAIMAIKTVRFNVGKCNLEESIYFRHPEGQIIDQNNERKIILRVIWTKLN